MNTTTLERSRPNYGSLASSEHITKAMDALSAKNFTPLRVSTGAEALGLIKKSIPAGATIMNGTSTTLQQIGFINVLKEKTHPWNNLHDAILAEKDAQKQAELRAHSVVSDYYLGSAHAVTEAGEIVIASNTGSQLPHSAFTSKNLILVVSTKKIVATLADAFDRIDTHVVPLEDARSKEAYGVGTMHNKTLILHGENPMMGRSVQVVFVEEDLGF